LHRFIFAVVLICNLPVGAQERRGAKAVFLDPTSGAAVIAGQLGVGRASSDRPRPDAHNLDGGAGGDSATGLMYYLELVKPSGEVLRVNSTRVFHSGERVRVHFQSNVNGRLTIVQKQKDAHAHILFPDRRVRAGDNRIRRDVDTVVPSERAWFQFDQDAGEEQLLVFLTTEEGYDAVKSEVARAEIGQAQAQQLQSKVEQLQGSKGLLIEVDDQSDKPAAYAVNTAAKEDKAQLPGVVALEITLIHKP
jgi:hypothetical protein